MERASRSASLDNSRRIACGSKRAYFFEFAHVPLDAGQDEVVRTVLIIEWIVQFAFFSDCPVVDESLLALLPGLPVPLTVAGCASSCCSSSNK
jgi:hypothetical protein